MLPKLYCRGLLLSLITTVVGQESTSHDGDDVAELEAKWGTDVSIFEHILLGRRG